MASNQACPSCAEPATLTCTVCNNIAYCSVECQETDEQAHNLLCSDFAHFAEPPTDGLDKRRAIFFPANEGKPKFVWLDVEDDYAEKKLDLAGYLSGSVRRDDIDRNPITNARIGYRIIVCYDRSLAYGHQNQSIKNAIAPDETWRDRPWDRDVLVYCGRQRHDAVVEIKNMDMYGYSHAVAELIAPMQFRHAFSDAMARKVDAVKLLCDGAMDRSASGGSVKGVSVPKRHPVMAAEKGIRCPLAMVSLRFDAQLDATDRVQRVVLEIRFVLQPTSAATDLTNRALLNLFTIIDPTHADFGGPLTGLGKELGTYYVTQISEGTLTADTIEALVVFSVHTQALIARTRELFIGNADILTSAQALAQITKEKWESFQAEWRQDRVAKINEVNNEVGGKETWLIESMSGVVVHRLKDGKCLAFAA